MVTVKLKGVHTVNAKGKAYYYAWRGGPKLLGEPGSPEFMASYQEALESRNVPDNARFQSIVILYKASPDYKKLANSTKRNWSSWLDRISDHFGETRIRQFDRPQIIRPIIRQWRAKYADKPEPLTMGCKFFREFLSYAVDPLAKISANPCEGIKQLYSNDRAAIIWTDEDIAELKGARSIDRQAYMRRRVGISRSILLPTRVCVSATLYACHGRMCSQI